MKYDDILDIRTETLQGRPPAPGTPIKYHDILDQVTIEDPLPTGPGFIAGQGLQNLFIGGEQQRPEPQGETLPLTEERRAELGLPALTRLDRPPEGEELPTGPGFIVGETAKETATSLWEGLRKDAVYFYGGLAQGEQALLTPVATAFDFYAEKAGLLPEGKASAFTEMVDGLAEIAGLTEAAAGPKAPGEAIPAAVAKGVGAILPLLPAIGALAPYLGVHTLPALSAVQASASGDPGEVAKAALTSYLLTAGLRAANAMPQGFKAAAAATTFGGITAQTGGDLDETIASAILGGALSLTRARPKGQSIKEFAQPTRSAILVKTTKAASWSLLVGCLFFSNFDCIRTN